VDASGTWHPLLSAGMFIGLALLVLPYLLRYRAGEFHGDYRAPFAGVPMQRQKVLRERVLQQQVDPPPDDEVRAMAELMRARRRDLLTPAGMVIIQSILALTLHDPWVWVSASLVLLVAPISIFSTLRQVRAGSAFRQRYRAG
jgi:hypothetical protein